MTPRRLRAIAAVAVTAVLLLARSAAAQTQYLSDLTWVSMSNGSGPVQLDRSQNGAPLTLNGVTYAKGLGAQSPSDVRYAVPTGCTALLGAIGVDDEVGTAGSVIFQVWADGVLYFDSGLMTGASATRSIDVSLAGRSQVALVVTDGGNGTTSDHADWAEARFTCGPVAPPTPLFSSPTAYPAGANTHSVGARDLNGDNTLDLVAANAAGNTVSVFIGTGSGSFGAATSYPVGLAPKHATLADFNRDTFLDIATSNQDGSTVTILLGLGDGRFGGPADYAVCSRAHESAAADFNADGNPDLAIACWGGSVISMLLGRGDGTFAPAVSYTVQSNPLSLAVGDFNADGKADVAVANNAANSVSVLLGRGDGTLNTAVTYPSGANPHGIRTADLNQDGRLDLVNANVSTDYVTVMLGRGDGTFGASVNYPAGVNPAGITLADVTGDAVVDILAAVTGGNYPVCCNPGGNVFALLVGRGDGAFNAPQFYTTGTTPFAVTVADFNNDGLADVATANWDTNDVRVHLHVSSTPDTTPPTVTSTTPAASATNVAPSTTVTATFSEAMNGATLTTSTVTLTATGAPAAVAATVSYDAATRVVTLTPGAALASQTVYTARVKGGAGGAADLAGNLLATDRTWSFTTASAPSGTIYLSDLTPTSATNGWGPYERDRSNGDSAAGDGGPLTIGGVVFPKGLGVHAAADLRYAIPSGCSIFSAVVGVDDEVGGSGSVVFQVYGDATLLGDSGVMLGTTANKTLNATLTGRTQLRLVVTDSGNGAAFDHADWADAQLTCGTIAPDTTPPTVTATTPAASATSVTLTTTVTATFSEAMNAATLTASTVTLTAAGAPSAVTATVAYDDTMRLVTLTPDASLAAQTVYTARVKGGAGGAADLAGNALTTDRAWSFTTASAPTGPIYLSDLTPLSTTNGWGPYERDRSNGDIAAGDGLPLTIGGVVFVKGLGIHAAADLRYAIPSGCSAFAAVVGVDDEVGSGGSVIFRVYGDATLLVDSGLMLGTTANKTLNATLTGRTQLRLVVTDGGNGAAFDHADWADAKLTCGTATPDTTPPTVTTTTPAASATNVALTTTVTATFSEAMTAATVTTSTVTLTAAGAPSPVAATLAYDSATRVATLTPGASLAPQTVYTARVRGGTGGAADLAGNVLATDRTWSFTTASAPSGPIYLSDLTPISTTNGWGPYERDQSNGDIISGDGLPLTIGGVVFPKGLGVHAAADLRYAIPSGCSVFSAVVGVDDEVGSSGSVSFQVYGDATLLVDSGLMLGTTANKPLSATLTGRAQLRLVVTDGGNGNGFDHGDWADAKLTCGTATPDTTPPTVTTTSPAASATNVALTTTVSATFSEAMNAATLAAGTVTLTAAGAPSAVNATVAYDAATQIVTLTPAASLAPQTVHTARVRGGTGGAADLAGNVLATDRTWSFTTASAPSGTIYLSDLTPISATNAWGPYERDQSNGDSAPGDGLPLTVGGEVFLKGLGVHAAADLRYAIPSGCSVFSAVAGIDDEVGAGGSVVFQVYGDATLLVDTGLLQGTSANRIISANVDGRTQLRLVTTDGGNGNGFDHADWAGAQLTCGTIAPDTTPPSVTTTAPATNAVNIAMTTAIAVTFSEAMKASSLTASTLTLTAAGATTPVPATVTYDVSTRTATLRPGSMLSPQVQYTARVIGGAGGVADLAGNVLASTYVWTFTSAGSLSGTVYLSDLTPSAALNGWGLYERDMSNGDAASNDGARLMLNGTGYDRGLGVHAGADLRFDVPAGCVTFTSIVGVDDEVAAAGSVRFLAYIDGTKSFDSGVMTGSSNSQAVSLNVAGRAQLGLVVNDGGDGIVADHADWADARLACGTSTLAISDVTVTEGNSGTSTATFTVTLTPAATQTVTVAYATAAGTATSGADYTAASGTLTFTAGVTSRQFGVPVVGDTTNEPNETFAVNLSSPANAVIADAQGVGTIRNDDATTDLVAPTVTARTPAPNAAGVTSTTTASATFSEPVVSSSIAFALTDGFGESVAGSLVYNAASRTATFTPSAPLPNGAAFSVSVSGAQDFSGNVMAAESRWGFTTGTPGFQDSIVISGLSNPTNVQFASDGRVFIAEKSGLIKVLDSLTDPSPKIFADLRTNVHNFWDRGLTGMALDPAFPAKPYVYVLYTYDAAIGGTAPRWGSPNVSSDPCPTPPGAMANGCVVSGRLSRLRADGDVMTGTEEVLIEDWFQQFPSHSVGSIVFGPDGSLYVSGGEGASFAYADYGQSGNLANDPPGGSAIAPPTSEGGALRAQDLRTTGDPAGLSGTIARVNPDTGAALSDNPL